MTHIQIIYLNGPSSSGKTTLAKALQDAFEEPFLHVGIDKIIGWMPEKFNNWEGGQAPLGFSWKASKDAAGNLTQTLQTGPYAQKIAETFRKVVATLAEMGHRLIIDDVSLGKQQVDEWKETLKGFPVLWVGVNAPLGVLEQREKKRGNRILGAARGLFDKVHVDASYDLEIDTHQSTLSENVEKIKSLASCFISRETASKVIEHYLPRGLSEIFEQQFAFPKQPLFGAVATIHRENQTVSSRVRTMRIYDFSEQGCPILLTHVSSDKWQDFVHQPHLSIAMVSENKLTQVIVHGTVQLNTPKTAPAQANHYWHMVRPDVRKIYDPAHTVGEIYREPAFCSIPQHVPDTFGIGLVIPSFWEVLSLSSDYIQSHRYQFHLKNGEWQKQRINVG